ncbi:MAG: OmpA family protein [Tenuifilaceae bacterium]|jgi:outer membrane protein OmpA-like peptidoglycan-associated protein|nr:OmpA family protein [Tenuifilaceae bacterium]
MKRIFLICTIVSLFLSFTQAQTSFVPVNLGSNVNSEYAEVNPVISWDGKTLFFNRINHPENTFGSSDSQDIWYSTLRDDGTWTKAQRLPETVNIGQYNAILSALDDGVSYLILGKFNRSGKHWVKRGFSIVQHLGNGQWSKPQAIKVKRFSKINKGKAITAYMTPDRELLFITFSTHPNSKKLSLYVSTKKKDGVYSRPRFAGGGPGNAMDPRSLEAPYLSADKNRLYFSADYGGRRANQNIHFAERSDKDFREWRMPQPVTDTINTPNWDSYFKMNAKESWAYYSSTTNSLGKADIFRVKIFEERPYLKLSGLILNQADQKLMLDETDYSILVNGEEFPELEVSKPSASFEVLLPLGQLYTLQPTMANWNGISADIDLRGVREYSEAKLNLYFSSIPYALVKGRVVDTRTDEIVPLSLNPKVLINGVASDSVKYDQFSGAFQALLPLGQSYTFMAKVDNFTSTPVVIDVTEVATYVEHDISLPVTSFPWVEVSGKVLDNSSLTPVLAESRPVLLINGQEADSIYIDPVSADFMVRLPYGKSYTIGVKADNFRTLDNQVDLSSFDRFLAIKQNVFAERMDANMVTLTGKLIDTKSGKPLEEGYSVKMRVNGVESHAFTFEPKTAEFSLRLPVGFNYDLTPSVTNFYNKFEPVDLTKTAPMSKIVRNFYVTPIEVGQSVDIQDIYFETGRAGLMPQSFRSLNALIEFLKEYPNVRVEIGGHTDNVGSAAVNQKVSEDRARSVAQYVIDQGIPAERVVSKGYGFSKPKASNRTAEGRAQNRRVDFTIIGI